MWIEQSVPLVRSKDWIAWGKSQFPKPKFHQSPSSNPKLELQTGSAERRPTSEIFAKTHRARLCRAAEPFHCQSSSSRGASPNLWLSRSRLLRLELWSILGIGSWALGFPEVAHLKVRSGSARRFERLR